MQFIKQRTNLDCGHRVMNECMKCFNWHGHTYLTDLVFSFENSEEIGYAIDFKEIKRVFVQFLQDYMDHGAIMNPHDEIFIKAVQKANTKLWLMSLNGVGKYCNPSVENIAKEVFLSMEIIASVLYPDEKLGLKIHTVTMYETPNCSTDCYNYSINENERKNFYENNFHFIEAYSKEKGILEYDDRKTGTCKIK